MSTDHGSSSSSSFSPIRIVRSLFNQLTAPPRPAPQTAYVNGNNRPPPNPEPRPVPQTAYIQGASTSATQSIVHQPQRSPSGSTSPPKKDEEEEKENRAIESQLQKVDESHESVHVLSNFVLKLAEKGVDGVRAEYTSIDGSLSPSTSCEAFHNNMEKNRYSDVFCTESTRVKLWFPNTKHHSDYIHANRISDPILPPNHYICTQGPTKETAQDFWRMVFQERTERIIMLCNPLEEGRMKCALYWPDQETSILEYPTLIVKNLGETEDEFITTNLSLERNPKYEWQMQDLPLLHVKLIRWNSWPDRGVPSRQSQLLQPLILLDRVRGYRTVIHCSAGIGRTGCLMALAIAYEQLRHGKMVDFDQIVRELRRQRAQSIQTEVQYLYICRVIVEYAFKHAGLSKKARIAGQSFLADYDQKTRRPYFAAAAAE
ncbi:unnamed protein product, partial [Mesorhabditis spiculigera]